MTVTPGDFDLIRKLLRDHSGILLGPGKEYLVETRLTPLAEELGLTSLAQLIQKLDRITDKELHARVVEALTTNETQFFRDVHPFETLKKTILPELIQKRNAKRTLNLWSAAASTGQEAYSLAMLLDEAFPELASWSVHLLGSDISGDALDRARTGRFSQIEVNRGLPARLLVKYFHEDRGAWCLADRIRERIEFRPINLVSGWTDVPRMDVVFLRNALIYFGLETKQSVLRRIHGSLQPDGYLFLGSAETLINIEAPFRQVRLDTTVCYQPIH